MSGVVGGERISRARPPNCLRRLLEKRCAHPGRGRPGLHWALVFRRLASLQGFEFFEGSGPVGTQEAGQAAVGQDFASGLALRAVVGFFVGVADAQDFVAASWARFAIAAVDCHTFAEGRYFFGEGGGCFGVEFVDPKL